MSDLQFVMLLILIAVIGILNMLVSAMVAKSIKDFIKYERS